MPIMVRTGTGISLKSSCGTQSSPGSCIAASSRSTHRWSGKATVPGCSMKRATWSTSSRGFPAGLLRPPTEARRCQLTQDTQRRTFCSSRSPRAAEKNW